jgi:hypothetical protein
MIAVGSTPRSSPTLRWVLAVTIAISATLCLAMLLCEDLKLPGVFQAVSSGSTEKAFAGGISSSDHNQFGLGYSKARVIERRKVPSFENGGVVLFFHLAKTGGTSIRENFSKAFPDTIEVKHIGTMADLAEYGNLVSRLLEGDRSDLPAGKTILFWSCTASCRVCLFCMHLMASGERLPRNSTPLSSPLRSSESRFRTPSVTLIFMLPSPAPFLYAKAH